MLDMQSTMLVIFLSIIPFLFYGQNVGVSTQTPNSTLDINGSVSQNISITTVSYTALSNDHNILASAIDSSIVISLPSAASLTGRVYVVKKTDSTTNAITIDANASETIDGSLTLALSSQYDNVKIISDGSNWNVLGNNSSTQNPVSTSTVIEPFSPLLAKSNFCHGIGSQTTMCSYSIPADETIYFQKFFIPNTATFNKARLFIKQFGFAGDTIKVAIYDDSSPINLVANGSIGLTSANNGSIVDINLTNFQSGLAGLTIPSGKTYTFAMIITHGSIGNPKPQVYGLRLDILHNQVATNGWYFKSNISQAGLFSDFPVNYSSSTIEIVDYMYWFQLAP